MARVAKFSQLCRGLSSKTAAAEDFTDTTDLIGGRLLGPKTEHAGFFIFITRPVKILGHSEVVWQLSWSRERPGVFDCPVI